ncbi:MAG: 50S ribosomal protein L19 [Holosporales bacterium]|jgi:large subunit ribosomal protein L19|nr:50S ribosomal protein L19 [Holosporales bacterium]
MNLIEQIDRENLAKLTANKTIVNFRAGDSVKVMVKVLEDTKERMQSFEGVVIAKKNRGINSSFKVRKISNGEGVERLFHLYSPNIQVEVLKHGKVRRAKLYYLRQRTGKSARIAEKKRIEEMETAAVAE